jgi:hypothetical protein
MAGATTRRLVIAALAVGLLAAPAPAGGGARKPNGIVFDIRTSQGIEGRITYLKHYEGEGRNFVQLEVEVLRTCTGEFGNYRERANVILQGHTRGNGFSRTRTQNSSTDSFRQRASVAFRPPGRSGGLPRWRRASGSVRAFRAIHDATTNVSCESGPISFRTTSSRRVRFGPRPPVIYVI